jgi:hypothetical protein
MASQQMTLATSTEHQIRTKRRVYFTDRLSVVRLKCIQCTCRLLVTYITRLLAGTAARFGKWYGQCYTHIT